MADRWTPDDIAEAESARLFVIEAMDFAEDLTASQVTSVSPTAVDPLAAYRFVVDEPYGRLLALGRARRLLAPAAS
jgi:hypothetical protein